MTGRVCEASGEPPVTVCIRMNGSAKTLFGRSEALEYWESRHRKQDELASGGDIGLPSEANEAFYAQRLGLLLKVIGGPGDRLAPPSVLDAGCGRGFFAAKLQQFGYAVTGVDASPTAVRLASTSNPGPHYVVGELDSFWLPDRFDIAVVIDVLFHITDDAAFEASLARIAAHVHLGGRLVITERGLTERVRLGDYIVHRPVAEYLSVLGTGFVHTDVTPYDFPGNPIAFYTFVRSEL